MAIDWNSKDTKILKLTLGSLIKYKDNAKTNREKENRDRSIAAITKVLESRGEL